MCSVSQMLAVPAAPYPVQKTQPDGSTLTVHINGDEFYHFYTTTDGYTVVKNDLGCFTYAQRVEGRLVPTAIVAHNPAERNATEQLYLSQVIERGKTRSKWQKPRQKRRSAKWRLRRSSTIAPSAA